MTRRITNGRGLRGQARSIDPERIRRNGRLGSDRDFGAGLSFDNQGRLQVDASALGLAESSRVDALEAKIKELEAVIKAAGETT